MTDHLLGEPTQQEGVLAGFRMDPDHRMLRLEHRRHERAHVVDLFGSHAAGRGGDVHSPVVLSVGMDAAQLFSHGPDARAQVLVPGDRVGPQRVAAHLGDDHRPQDGKGGWPLDEGHVGVPVVGRRSSPRVEIEEGGVGPVGGQGGVGSGHRSEAAGEGELLIGFEVLARKEGNPVSDDGRSDLTDGVFGQCRAQVDALDDRPDAGGERPNGE